MIPPKTLSNPWKRRGVFTCSHPAHLDFAGCVSPYHVLREKRCFPQGCIYFQWRCRRLDKAQSCKRKFTHVGRLCKGCKEYREEKIHQQPRLLLTQGQWLDYRRDLEQFEDWFDATVGRTLECTAEVAEVKPSFVQELGAGSRVRFRGFLLVLTDSFLHRTRLDFPVFLRVSRRTQERHQFRAGDYLEFRAVPRQDLGRVVLERMHAVEVLRRGDGPVWTSAEGIVAKRTGTVFRSQPEQCLLCPAGTLLDVQEDSAAGERRYRRLLCLEGVRAVAACPHWIRPATAAGGTR